MGHLLQGGYSTRVVTDVFEYACDISKYRSGDDGDAKVLSGEEAYLKFEGE